MTELEEVFRTYNHRYFGGRLPNCEVVWSSPKKKFLGHFVPVEHYIQKSDGTEQTVRITYLIEISRRLKFSNKLWGATLLHEMVHLKLRGKEGKSDHGHKFQREMKRLVKLGAFNGLW